MRPRHKAAENKDVAGTTDGSELASMRPRHKAAENEGDIGALGVGELWLQ